MDSIFPRMEYRRFGKTELNLSVLSLGGMRYPGGWDKPKEELPKNSLEAAYQTTKKALLSGINHIETAQGYGKSENLYGAILGNVLKEIGKTRKDVIITTKSGPKDSYKAMRESIDDSLIRLKVDAIDNFDIHGINNEEKYHLTFKKKGALQAAMDAKKAGLIHHIGFSTHGSLALILKCLDHDELESINLHYYYIWQRNWSAIQKAAQKDMGVFIISPTDKGGQLFNPPKKLSLLCSPLTPIAFNHQFNLSHPEIHTLSVGAGHPDELDAHLMALKDRRKLSDQLATIKSTLDEQMDLLGKDKCTLCDECLPCPELINIPEVLRFRNLDVAFDLRSFGQYRYNMFSPTDDWFTGAYGNRCTDCGDCLPRCPENLEIPRLLRDTHQRLFKKA